MNLKQFDDDYENAPTKAKIDLTPGKYTGKLTDFSFFDTKDDRPCLSLTFQITDGADHVGNSTGKIYGLDKADRLSFMKDDMFHLGILVNKMSLLPEALEKAKGVSVRLESKQNGKYTNLYIQGRATTTAEKKEDEVPF